MGKVKLKPCPFCGGEAHISNITYNTNSDIVKLNGQSTFYGVNCCLCGSTSQGLIGSKTEEQASEKWNRRAGEKP